ncbi:MAG: hypothetical protein ACKV0T_15810 [Planctomycetales bacterium]
MLFRMSRILSTIGIVAAAGANTAFGQFFCCPPPPCCCPPVVCVQPAFRTVPVTELQEVKQVVQRPVVETKYVEQPVTEYRRVVETKTAEIPTVSYQNVTEYQTIQRDMGSWQTQYQYRPKLHPCQYDSRPDVLGFLNRAQYSVRMAFTPDYAAQRIYTPRVVTQQIPITRQVAVRGTQTVNYQVARVVPTTTTRKVAVNSVRMVAEEIVTKRPVTVMKTIPWGGAYAMGAPAGAPTTTTAALQPTPDPKTSATRIMPKEETTAAAPAKERPPRNLPDALTEDEAPGNDAESTRDADSSKSNIRRNGQGSIQRPAAPASKGTTLISASGRPLGQWVARKKSPPAPAATPVGPAFPEMVIAQNATP